MALSRRVGQGNGVSVGLRVRTVVLHTRAVFWARSLFPQAHQLLTHAWPTNDQYLTERLVTKR